jgi:zinc protease
MQIAHRHTLKNGLTLIVQEDFSTPLVVVNVLYDVGARDESPTKTGFAHLFEHFMFEGSIHIEEFDTPLEYAGGESNAFTTNDLTNYYDILPAQNIETALWLESDRMLSLAFETESLETQKKVVTEEFKEHYINKPYGNVWHELSALAYQQHPYRWPTIGLELSHVADAQMEDVKAFFCSYYQPNNAILSICGAIKNEDAIQLVEKWFGDIPSSPKKIRSLPVEPIQTSPRYKTITADVPAKAIYKAYKMPARTSPAYYSLDLLRDAIAGTDTASLYRILVKEKRWLNTVTCYLTETLDEGLFVIEGKLTDDVDFAEVDNAIQEILNTTILELDETHLNKLKNKFETYTRFSDTNLMNRAFNLAFYELLGDANLLFSEIDRYNAVKVEDIKIHANACFQPEVANTIFYDVLKTATA